MNVFLLTSVPITPPWDQGDKNLAYTLATALPDIQFQVLSTKNGLQADAANVAAQALYTSRRPGLRDKARVFAWLFSNRLLDELTFFRESLGLVPAAEARQIADQGPDLYHLIYRPFRLSSWFFKLLPEFRRRPTIHTIPATADGLPLNRDLFFADRLVALSEYGVQALQQLGLRNVVHIPPGIQIQDWENLCPQTETYKAELGLSGRPVLLFPGHYGPGQGADTIVEALPHLLQAVPDACLIFACRIRSSADALREQQVRQAIGRMGLEHAVRFYQTVKDMQPLIGASDVVLLPLSSMRDKVDIPTTLLESMAAGKPIVISDIPPMNELIRGKLARQGPAGLLAPAGEALELARATISLLQKPSLRMQMGARGQQLVRGHFDIQRVAQQYASLYQEVLD